MELRDRRVLERAPFGRRERVRVLPAALERRGDYAAAGAAAERGLHEDPAIPQLHKNLGDCYYRSGRYDDAIGAYERALGLDPALGGDVYFKLGNIRYRRGEKGEAVTCWERALELAPTNATARNNLETLGRVR